MSAADAIAQDETRRRCAYVELQVDKKRLQLEPAIADDGTLLEFAARSPPNESGGYVVVEMAPVHGPTCDDLAACTCGAQAAFEALVLRT